MPQWKVATTTSASRLARAMVARIVAGSAIAVPGWPGPTAKPYGTTSEKPTNATRRPRRVTIAGRVACCGVPAPTGWAPASVTLRTVSAKASAP